MSLRSRTSTLAALTLLSAALAGCSEFYFDRRDTVSIASGEAMAANRVTHMIDPWPPASANRNIAYNGERMQAAAERYRRHRVIRPVSPMTTSTNQPASLPPLTTEEIPGSQSSQSPLTNKP